MLPYPEEETFVSVGEVEPPNLQNDKETPKLNHEPMDKRSRKLISLKDLYIYIYTLFLEATVACFQV